ncbi:MAG: deoxyribodipyrimidine photo-lyase [Candidatus Altiarchaeota archaeon]|nr:deoxyribodipyrimidine photo-lyase [Candidatus Altiarchaeota archaeon]
MEKALHIFRRDLRLQDNTALIEALKAAKKVIPCFIFDPRQVGRNEFKSMNAVQFMTDSLQDLEEQLAKKDARLFLFHGEAENIVERILTETGASAVYVNRDYTPYSIARDAAIKDVCIKNDAQFHGLADALLTEPESVRKKDGKPYTVFTPFHRRALQEKVRQPKRNNRRNYYKKRVSFEEVPMAYEKILPERNKNAMPGGRSRALNILAGIDGYHGYGKERDYPSLDATTHLSAHLKFGTVSIRETYYKIADILGADHPLIRQLYWRDFYTHIGYGFPHVFGRAFRKKYDMIRWGFDEDGFRAWREGKTGLPLIDAGMRQLNATGYMHNRVRMIAASFLVKDLHIDWRLGERYFAQKLVDYDPCVNNGNWQWTASTGCDAQPYFRVFNPWLQQKRFDTECEYVKRWCPELEGIPAKTLHNLYKRPAAIKGYPSPIVDHAKESAKSKAIYAAVKKRKG